MDRSVIVLEQSFETPRGRELLADTTIEATTGQVPSWFSSSYRYQEETIPENLERECILKHISIGPLLRYYEHQTIRSILNYGMSSNSVVKFRGLKRCKGHSQINPQITHQTGEDAVQHEKKVPRSLLSHT